MLRRLVMMLAIAAVSLFVWLPVQSALPQDDAAAGAAADDDATPGELTLDTERVVVFKDGYGLVMKTATGTVTEDGIVFTAEVPQNAVLGCLWALLLANDNDDDPGKVLATRADWDESVVTETRARPVLTMVELLRANTGRTVNLHMPARGENDPEVITGRVISVLAKDAEEFERKKLLEQLRAMGAKELKLTLQPTSGHLVAIATGSDTLVLPIGQVQRVSGDGLVTAMEETEVTVRRAKRLEFVVGTERAGEQVKLRLFWFSPGLRWIPTYRISGDLKSDAIISLQGELINDLEDIDNAEWNLVVGVPNFRFKNTRSPLTLESMIAQVSHRIPRSRGSEFSNAIRSQVQMEGMMGGPVATDGAMDLAPELKASRTADLYVYTVPNFRLGKGGRATVPLWQGKAALEHVYTMDLDIRRNARSGETWTSQPGVSGQSPMQLAVNRFWHQLRLTNNTDGPWTTGAALMMRDHLPLGQELMTYTPPGGKVELPVTIAVDMRGSYTEEEISRENNALVWAGYQYAKITKRATIQLTSYRGEASNVRIRIGVGGAVTANSGGATIRADDFRAGDWQDRNLAQVNNHSDVSWELSVEPGESQTLTFDFHYYVR